MNELHVRLQAAWHWWLDGLLYPLPASLRRLLQGNRDRLTIAFDGDRVRLRPLRAEGDAGIAIDFRVQDEASMREIAIERARRAVPGAPIVLLLARTGILQRRIDLPRAARENLRQVLEFEMDRQTPFDSGEVYFDYRTLATETSGDRLQVELAVAPKEAVDEALGRLEVWQLAPGAVDVTGEDGRPAGYNLLPPERRPAESGGRGGTVGVLAVALVLLLGANLYTPPLRQRMHLGALEAEVEGYRRDTVQLERWRQESDRLQRQTRFLHEKRQRNAMIIVLLDELTRLLPGDSWVERLSLYEGEVHIQGLSSNASSLIGILEASRYFTRAQFRSPVTHDGATHQDRFHVSAQLRRAERSDEGET